MTATLPRRAAPGGGRWRLALAGLGNVGSGVLEILHRSAGELALRHGVDFAVTGVAELGGAAVDPEGLDVAAVLEAVASRRPVASLERVGRPSLSPAEMVAQARPDVLLEATPVDLDDGEPGLGTAIAALEQGTHVVLANKGPLALAYRELSALGDVGDGLSGRPRLRFSACICGALPVMNVGRRDLAGSRVLRFEGVLNGTTQSILRAMEQGRSYDEALRDAQERGIAEHDPALDVDGLDAACKLVIVANAVLDQPATLADVEVAGIRGVGAAELAGAAARGRRIVLLCAAELDRDRDVYRLSVGPAELPLTHPLARLDADEMGVVYTTDTVGRLSAASYEPGALPASAAMLRDVLDIVRSEPLPPSAAAAPAPPELRVQERVP